MKTPFKELLGILVVGAFLTLVAHGLKYLNPEPNLLDELEEKIEKVQQKEIILTESEKELEKKSAEKEWQDLDKETDK